MNKTVLKVEGLSKSFKKRRIVDNVSFEAKAGEILGFLGANGAGKTTTIRMITGLISADSGTVIIDGHNIKSNFEKAMDNVGAIVEIPFLYEYMTGMENIKLFAKLYKASEEGVNEAIKVSGLKDRLNDKVKEYSLGMKQRIGLAVALMKQPKLLILDEPTNGLDPMGIKDLREFLKDLSHNKNISVVVSSHILMEMEQLCDRVVIISDGKVICTKTMDEINKESSLEEVFINSIKEAEK
ncbi:ABC transporter ATP-binding protein [Clostridium sp. NSJ-49]|uniref:ABC transporter ATP-binding protein n=1 Tax=Clostridium TaxID=1485 RepID=UPI00164A318D|nr:MULTISPECIES: ABC transporter ATP-binding protein [unclassified Clostridium]MBC5625508.1 ABC transporter ATP-binding protein [Clostridium sp. NSJ-49]MCD2501383.1 ABC transporter ATP-binding protein [Clostridium sp. NSJ-145]